MTGPSEAPHESATASLARELDRAVPDVATATGASTVFLVGLSGSQAGKLFKVPSGESILGRSSRSLVVFDEKAVSQRHAQLVFSGGRCVLTDLLSTNGVYVNEVRIGDPVELRAGDVVRLGKTSLGFLADADGAEPHTRALARAVTGRIQLSDARAMGVLDSLPAAPLVVGTSGVEPNGLDMALDKLALAWRALRTYWRLLVLGILVFALLGALSMFVRPPAATAKFRIFLKQQGSEQAQAGRYVTTGGEYFRFASESFANSDLVKQTMRGFHMPTQPSASILDVAGRLALTPEDQSIYVGKFSHPSAEFAERFLAAHLHNYLEREIGKSIRVLASEVELLRKQYDENETQLKQTETELQAFKEKHLAGLPENATSQLESRVELQARALQLRANLDRFTQELALGRKQHAAGNALVADRVDRAQPYDAALAEVRKELVSLRASGFKEESPEVTRLRTKEQGLLAEQSRSIAADATDTERRANREQTALGDRVDQLAVEVSATKAELDMVQGRLGEIDKVASMMPAVEAKYSDLSRSLSAGQSLHQHLYEQLKAKELKLDFERASVAARYEVVDPPSADPIRPAVVAGQRALIAGLVGLVFAMIAAAVHWVTTYARKRDLSLASSRALARP